MKKKELKQQIDNLSANMNVLLKDISALRQEIEYLKMRVASLETRPYIAPCYSTAGAPQPSWDPITTAFTY